MGSTIWVTRKKKNYSKWKKPNTQVHTLQAHLSETLEKENLICTEIKHIHGSLRAGLTGMGEKAAFCGDRNVVFFIVIAQGFNIAKTHQDVCLNGWILSCQWIWSFEIGMFDTIL